ncbi:MAG: protease modulator HflC [Victivallaceae bacterium]|nr:protease modulator HflC [Victivallaceae bacterium]
MTKSKFFTHWPTLLLGIVVASFFLIAIFTFQIEETETAIVTTLGTPSDKPVEPGLHLRWPYPIQEVYRFDRRYRCFSGTIGKDGQETTTRDNQNIIVSIFVNYRIADAKKFYSSFVTIRKGEAQLNNWMRGTALEVFGRYNFGQLVNVDPKKMCLTRIQGEIRKEVSALAAPSGIEIRSVGINSLNIPESISKSVFDRMIQERKVEAEKFLAEGKSEAQRIRTDINRKRDDILAQATAQAKEIRAQGDAEAAKYYATYKQSPELAAFLRKLDSLRSIMKTKTTLILDTNSAPFDIFKLNAEQLQITGPRKN